MSALSNRVLRLEGRRRLGPGARRGADGPVGPSAVEELAERLASLGLKRDPNESLAEMTARALGWSISELREELERRAGS